MVGCERRGEMSDHKIYTFCPECGINTGVDEDGLCVSCGATAMGKGIDELNALRDRIRTLEEETDKLQDQIASLRYDLIESENDKNFLEAENARMRRDVVGLTERVGLGRLHLASEIVRDLRDIVREEE
jgi:hypothetical protein